jgi:hypothetical protein
LYTQRDKPGSAPFVRLQGGCVRSPTHRASHRGHMATLCTGFVPSPPAPSPLLLRPTLMVLADDAAGGRSAGLCGRRARWAAEPGPTVLWAATERISAPDGGILCINNPITRLLEASQRPIPPSWRTSSRMHDGRRRRGARGHQRPVGFGLLGWALECVEFGEV